MVSVFYLILVPLPPVSCSSRLAHQRKSMRPLWHLHSKRYVGSMLNAEVQGVALHSASYHSQLTELWLAPSLVRGPSKSIGYRVQ